MRIADSPLFRRGGGSRRRSVLLALLIATSGCATSNGDSQSSSSLPMVLEELRAHPEKRRVAEAACERSIADNTGDFPINLFFGGLLDVPAHKANGAFCAAIVEAVIAGDLTRSDLSAFELPSAVRGKEPLGTLLRKLMIAHERLYAQQAKRPPQAQSCGCGQ